jgi:hypothetical protein
MALQHLRSNTASKRPTPASMADGQLAINTNATSPGVFFKDAGGALIKVGPVHVGTSAPNSSPAAGGSTGNSVGEQWLDTSGGSYVFKVWDGSAWRSEAGEFVDAAGDTMTGDLVMNNADIVFEGSSEDDFETTLTVTNPTADRTITLPDTTGTVVTTGDTGSVTSTMITDGTIVNADINASAAIALSKLATGALPTAITVASANIVDGTIVNADVNAAAAIAGTKIDPDFGSQTIETTGVINAGSGTAAAPSVSVGTTDNGIYSPGADQVAVATNGTGRLLVDANGNVGVGATPPAWASWRSLDISTQGALASTGTQVALFQNVYWNGSSYIYKATGSSTSILNLVNGALVYQSGASGTAGNPATLTEKLRITSDGLVGIGTSLPGQQMVVRGSQPFLEIRDARQGNWSGEDVFSGILFGTDDTTTSVDPHAFIKAVHTRSGTGHSSADAGLTFGTSASTSTPATERMRIDDQGRVGIGTTSPSQKLEVNGNIRILNANNLQLANTGDVQFLNAAGTSYSTGIIGSSDNMILYTTDLERARIDSSGRLLVGTSSAVDTSDAILEVVSGGNTSISLVRNDTTVSSSNTLSQIKCFGNDDNGNYEECGRIAFIADGDHATGDKPTRLVFSTTPDGSSSPSERMRISSNGDFNQFTDSGHGVRTALTSTSGIAFFVANGASSTLSGTVKMVVRADGDLENVNNSYGAYSDVKLKENIIDAASQWNDIKDLRVRKYNYKEETGHDTHTQIGLIAQEVETVSPGLVSESPDRDEEGNDLGTVTKSVNYSVLYMKAVKALQEAMERIETLEAKVAALEAN